MRPVLLCIVMIAALAGGCQSMERPEVFITNLTPLESTLFEQRLQVDIRIQNPNDREVSVRGMDFKLDLNGVRLARGVSSHSFVLPALGEAQTTVTASTTLLDLARQLTALYDQGELTYQLKGRIHLEGGWPGTISFEQDERLATLPEGLGLPRMPDDAGLVEP